MFHQAKALQGCTHQGLQHRRRVATGVYCDGAAWCVVQGCSRASPHVQCAWQVLGVVLIPSCIGQCAVQSVQFGGLLGCTFVLNYWIGLMLFVASILLEVCEGYA